MARKCSVSEAAQERRNKFNSDYKESNMIRKYHQVPCGKMKRLYPRGMYKTKCGSQKGIFAPIKGFGYDSTHARTFACKAGARKYTGTFTDEKIRNSMVIARKYLKKKSPLHYELLTKRFNKKV